MKKFLVIAASLIIANSVFAQNKITFSDGKVSGELPAGWDVINTDSPVSFYMFAPETKNDKFRENITVTHEQFAPGQKFTVEQYLNAVVTNLQTMWPDLEIVESGKDWIIYKIEVNGIKVTQYARVIIKKTNATFICASANPEDFDSYRDVFKQIIFAFK